MNLYPTFRKHWEILSPYTPTNGDFLSGYNQLIQRSPRCFEFELIVDGESPKTRFFVDATKYGDNISTNLILSRMFEIMLGVQITIELTDDEINDYLNRYFWAEKWTSIVDESIIIDVVSNQPNYIECFVHNIGSAIREGDIIVECPICEYSKVYTFPQNPSKVVGILPGRSFKLKIALPGYDPDTDYIAVEKHF